MRSDYDDVQRRLRVLMLGDCNCVNPMQGGPCFPHSKWCRTRILHDAHHAITELRKNTKVEINFVSQP